MITQYLMHFFLNAVQSEKKVERMEKIASESKSHILIFSRKNSQVM